MELDTDVLIIGAGMSGIGFAVQLLRKYRHERFEIIEKEEYLGGTWWVNTYPGCGVDVASHYYAYSFCMNPNWSRKYPLQPEILAYIKDVVAKYNLEQHVRFNTVVESAHWDGSSGTWLVIAKNLQTSDRYQRRCKILVSAVGILSGKLFHTARWDHSFDWHGKEVVIIGNGCSASQVVPAITEGKGAARKVTQFARQAQWVFERPNPIYSTLFKFTMRWFPLAMRVYRTVQNYYAEIDFKSFPTIAGAPIRKLYADYHGAYIRRVSPEKYHDFLIPKIEVGCKRRVMDSDYLESLNRDNVELVYNDPVQEIVEDGVRTVSDRVIKADAIVMANGFSLKKPLLELNLHGQRGVSVAEHWNKVSEGGCSSYFGTCLAEFPNFFIMMGPNTASGHGSVTYITECQINFALQLMRPILDALKAQRSILPVIRQKNDIVQVKPAAEQADIKKTYEKAEGLVWSSGCTSWALDEKSKKNTIMYPDFQYKFWLRSIFVPWRDFELSRSQTLTQSLASKSFGTGGWIAVAATMGALGSALYLYRGSS